MKIITEKESFVISNDHPYAKTILLLAKTYSTNDKDSDWDGSVPKLWAELDSQHKQFLFLLSKSEDGVPQRYVEKKMNIDWQQLRGALNGITRICTRLGYTTPVHKVGTNAKSRYYFLDKSVASEIRKLLKTSN
jgi:hypothetical protein